MKEETSIEMVERNYRNFHTSSAWTCFLNKEQVEYLLHTHGDFIMSNGYGRRIVCDRLTPDSFKVYTEPA